MSPSSLVPRTAVTDVRTAPSLCMGPEGSQVTLLIGERGREGAAASRGGGGGGESLIKDGEFEQVPASFSVTLSRKAKSKV